MKPDEQIRVRIIGHLRPLRIGDVDIIGFPDHQDHIAAVFEDIAELQCDIQSQLIFRHAGLNASCSSGHLVLRLTCTGANRLLLEITLSLMSGIDRDHKLVRILLAVFFVRVVFSVSMILCVSIIFCVSIILFRHFFLKL